MLRAFAENLFARMKAEKRRAPATRLRVEALDWWGLAGSNRRPPACERQYKDIVCHFVLHMGLFAPKEMALMIFSPLFPCTPNLSMVSCVVINFYRTPRNPINGKTVLKL